MFLRCTRRKKDGKLHEYWSIVENRRLSEGRTTFVIAHRLSTVQHADLILVLKGGEIIGRGTHAELSQINGFYREVRRTWLRCLRRRSQKSRRMGWSEFENLTARFRLPTPRITRTWAQGRI